MTRYDEQAHEPGAALPDWATQLRPSPGTGCSGGPPRNWGESDRHVIEPDRDSGSNDRMGNLAADYRRWRRDRLDAVMGRLAASGTER